MLFKSEYAPDAGSDDAPEAVAESRRSTSAEFSPEVAPAPVSEARQRLAKLLLERDEAQSEAKAAQASIAKLNATQSLASPFEQQLAMLQESESQSLRRWSDDDSDAPPPAPNVEARLELELAHMGPVNQSLEDMPMPQPQRNSSSITIDFEQKAVGLAAAIETTSGARRKRLEDMLAVTIKRLVADFADEVLFVTAAEADELLRAA